MKIEIIINKNPIPLASLNKTVQDIHSCEYPQLFKPYDYNSVLSSMTDSLSKENWFSFLAISDKEPAGYSLFYIRDYKENPFRKAYKAIHIDQICVKSDYQRHNIGSMLMKAIEKFAIDRDIHKLELTFWEKNIHTKNFYEKYGFERMMNFVSKDI